MDKSCPTFSHFSVHEWNLIKLSRYLTVFPSHFNNIVRNCEIFQYFMRFHKTNDISWNFSGITLGFREVAKYFVHYWFCFRCFQKMTAKFWLHLNRFEISKIHTWLLQKLKSQYRTYLVRSRSLELAFANILLVSKTLLRTNTPVNFSI
jgi:hypothetical protein